MLLDFLLLKDTNPYTKNSEFVCEVANIIPTGISKDSMNLPSGHYNEDITDKLLSVIISKSV